MGKCKVFKITYPNGKIYVGSDVTDTLTYFGSFDDSRVYVDFSEDQRRDFTVRKQVLFETDDKREVLKKAVEFIRKLRSNDPLIGYNRSPKFRPERQETT